MAREIERKFLVDPGRWRPGPAGGVRIRQGYLSLDPARIVRVRRAGDRGTLTVKGTTVGITRSEYDYAIPAADADALLDELCHRPLIEKTRYHETWAGRTWEIDRFEGENQGLIVAEVELADADEVVAPPPWAGREVSDDPRYTNASLIRLPFRSWGHDA
ncbi:MAG TPA: CYTH domain-containing protein [Gemmatimonadales bacterium]|jgi:adenylate cyclase|nr:CYTH domain-containing protein [Gemmatimonadales bacterium]